MNSMHTSIQSSAIVGLRGLLFVSRRGCGRFAWLLSFASVFIVSCTTGSAAFAQRGMLQTIREDVRGENVSSPSSRPDDMRDDRRDECYEPNPWLNDQDASGCGSNRTGSSAGSDIPSVFCIFPAAGAIILSPLWAPRAMLGDDFNGSGYFVRFPYDGDAGYIRTSRCGEKTRPLAVRLDVEYAETFDRLESVNGHLLVETSPRFGVAAALNHLEERLPSGGRDRLDIGNCNVVYRFAQNEWAEFRTGLGFNWMKNTERTELGFNFTYAVDLYPRKPWVLSAEIDAGTLGDAGLFQFRTTTGVVFHGVETYIGYEYTDIGRTHWNSLIAGVRLWF
jgi:hypothetical protein